MKFFTRSFFFVSFGLLLFFLPFPGLLTAQTADTVGIVRVDSLRTLVVLRDTTTKIFTGYYVLLGGRNMPVENLTDFLSRSGFGENLQNDEFLGGKPSLGIGVNIGGRRVRLMGEFLFPVAEVDKISTSQTRVREISFSTLEWQFRMAYSIVSTGGLEIFPLVGLGSRSSTLDISEKERSSFSDIFADSAAFSYSFNNTGLDIALGLGAEYNFHLAKKKSSTLDLSLGVRAEYALGFLDNWHQAGRTEKLDGGADLSPGGFNIWLTLGTRTEWLREFYQSIVENGKE